MMDCMKTSNFDQAEDKGHNHKSWQDTSSNAGNCVITHKTTFDRHVHRIVVGRDVAAPVVEDVEMTIHFKHLTWPFKRVRRKWDHVFTSPFDYR